MRYTVNTIVVSIVLPVTPAPCFIVEIGNTSESTTCHEVALYELNKPLHSTFRERMPRFAEFCFKADRRHKRLVFFVPNRLAIGISSGRDTLHVVCQYVFRNSHALKRVDHTDKEILLLGVGKELHIPLTAMMADHGKAGSPVGCSGILFYIDESPVHLEGFSRLRGVPPPTVPLWGNDLSLRRNKVFMF